MNYFLWTISHENKFRCYYFQNVHASKHYRNKKELPTIIITILFLALKTFLQTFLPSPAQLREIHQCQPVDQKRETVKMTDAAKVKGDCSQTTANGGEYMMVDVVAVCGKDGDQKKEVLSLPGSTSSPHTFTPSFSYTVYLQFAHAT